MKKKFKRLEPKDRKEQLLKVAIELARTEGFNTITSRAVATKAGVTYGLVTKYFGTMNNLRRTVMRTAIKQEVIEIIAQGLAVKNPYTLKAPAHLRGLASDYLRMVK